MTSAPSSSRRQQSRQIHDRSRIALIDVFRLAFEEKDAHASHVVHRERDNVTLTSELSQRSNARRLGVDEETLRAHVRDHLSILMNTIRLDATVDLSDTPHVARSVVNYGFQDLSNMSRKDLIAPYISRSIKQSLLDHEPRLVKQSLNVKVEAIEGDVLNKGGSLIAAPDARVIVQAGEEEEILYADLDLSEIGQNLTSLATDGHYSRPDVFELSVDTRAKDGVEWK